GGGLLGAALGTTFMVPVGVHLANNQRGNLGQGIAASGFTLAAGIGFSMLINDARPMLLVPLAQIISSIATERRTEGPLTAPGISPYLRPATPEPPPLRSGVTVPRPLASPPRLPPASRDPRPATI